MSGYSIIHPTNSRLQSLMHKTFAWLRSRKLVPIGCARRHTCSTACPYGGVIADADSLKNLTSLQQTLRVPGGKALNAVNPCRDFRKLRA